MLLPQECGRSGSGSRCSHYRSGQNFTVLFACIRHYFPRQGGNLNCAGAHHGNPTSPRNARSYVQEYEEWLITGYECPIYGVREMLGEYESLDKLNYLAVLTDEFSLSDQEKLVVIMEAECDDVSDIDDLINLTFNLDYFDVMPSISDESDLG